MARISSNVSGTGLVVDLQTTLDLIITAAGSVVSDTSGVNSGNAVRGFGSGHDVQVFGSVYGESHGVWLGNGLAQTAQTLLVDSHASISSLNQGTVLYGSGSRLTNNGSIYGGEFGVVMGGIGGSSTVINRGFIDAGDTAILAEGGNTQTLTITNFGAITGAAFAFQAFSPTTVSVEIINNRGSMVGSIDFGAGADVYDGRFGTVDGTILGGIGADTFRVGAGIEVIDGGADADLLDFRLSTGVRVALDGSVQNSGVAAGDIYTNIENLYGSLTGADTLIGDALANKIRGYDGVDSIAGGGGNDVLIGGIGKDKMTGGTGSDSFYFSTKTEAGDVISDFSNISGNDDRFMIQTTLGGGLTAGVLAATAFQSRADNIAQDSTDRFIFRTTDKTVWFDADGSGSGAAYMVADLQSTAVVTAADFMIFV